MKQSMRGVTLVELMVVIAITAILAGTWAKHANARRVKEMHRAKTIAAFKMMPRPKVAVTEYFIRKRTFPLNNSEAGLPSPEVLAGIETESVEVQYGAIHIKLKKNNPDSPDKILSFRPSVLKAEPYGPYITWICGNQEADSRLTVLGFNRTNIENDYLPRQCRGSGSARGVEAVSAKNVNVNKQY